MKSSLSIKELIAVIIRHGRTAVILMLVCGLLAGAYKARALVSEAKSYSEQAFDAEVLDEEYRVSLEEYYREKASLDTSLKNCRNRLRGILQYNDASILAKVNPYEEWVTGMTFVITPAGAGDSDAEQRIFLINQAVNQYLAYFSGVPLQNNLPGYDYQGAADKYIREMITLEDAGSGTLVLEAIGVGWSDSQQLAEAVSDLLTAQQDGISKATIPHTLEVVSSATKMVVDVDLADKQNADIERTAEFKSQIGVLDTKLKALKMPTPNTVVSSPASIAKESAQFAVLGVILALFLDVFLIILLYLFSDRVEFASHLGENLSIPFLGSVKEKGSVWKRLSDRYLGEHSSGGSSENESFIQKTSSVYLNPNAPVALLTTLNKSEADAAVSSALRGMTLNGNKPAFIANAAANPAAVEAISSGMQIVLLEQEGKSRWRDVSAIADMVKTSGNAIKGYVKL